MSNDLISRKAVIELIESCHELKDAYCLIDYINELPVSDHLDKVVKIFEDRLNFYEERFSQMSGNDRDLEDWGSIKSYKDAIEIVKTGR